MDSGVAAAGSLIALACWVVLPWLTLLERKDSVRTEWGGLIGAGGASLLVVAWGITLNSPADVVLPPPFHFGATPVAFHGDLLSAWFLLLIGVVSIALAPYLPAYMRHGRGDGDMRIFWIALGLLCASMAGVVLAANAQTFLVAWEVMSLSSFVLVVTHHVPTATRRAGMIYLGATRAGTMFLAGGFLWAYSRSGSWAFADWHLAGAAALGPGLLILLGLGVKAGMWPFHLWLPTAHPAAPSPVSALMSGVMVKVALYGMIRFFVLPGHFDHVLLGKVLLALGTISAFWGVLFALLQHDLKRLLAYHTVENVGLIIMGIGACLAARDAGLASLAAVALASALFHTLNHGLFKSLLFLGAGAVDHATGTRDIEHLGGLGLRMPWTFRFFLLGSAAICALPPLNGFASEWLLYQALLGVGGSSAASPLGRFLAMAGIGWIALVGALALACFLKACGVIFLGMPRSRGAEKAVEVPRGMLVAQAFLGLACVALGLGAPAVLQVLQPLVWPISPYGPSVTTAWNLPMGPLVLVLLLTMGVGAAWMQAAARRHPVRTYITWECGFGDPTPRMQVTATSFAQPIARLFGALYHYALHLHVEGDDRRYFPQEMHAEPETKSLLQAMVYAPLMRAVSQAGTVLARLQAGSIHLYLLTMFVTLCTLLLLGRYVR